MKSRLAALFIIASSVVNGQQMFDAPSALDSFTYLRPRENVYVLVSQTEIIPGETLWGKAWITLNGRPSPLSKILYVELSDTEGRLVQKLMLKTNQGSCSFNMDLPKDIKPGKYSINAYSLWMLNFPEDIFHTEILIRKPGQSEQIIESKASSNWSVRFFPEGGDLIHGISSVIAFKANQKNGLPVDCKGTVKDQSGIVVASFASEHDGMGRFTMLPDAAKNYVAEVEFNGNYKTIQLPSAKSEGMVLQLSQSRSKIFVNLQRSEKQSAKYNKPRLIAVQNDQVVYSGQGNMDEGLDAFAINTKTFKPGVIQLTVFDEGGNPIAERLVFYGTGVSINARESHVSETVTAWQRIKQTLSFADIEKPDLAIRVGKPGISQSQLNIISENLLSAWLKGPVYNPAQYFQQDLDSLWQAKLDLLMLTNGWRRYVWKEVKENPAPVFRYPVETSLAISGKLQGGLGKSFVANGRINLIVKGDDSTQIVAQAVANEKGFFSVQNLDFSKSANILYQGSNTKNAEAIVIPSFFDRYVDTLKTPHNNSLLVTQYHSSSQRDFYKQVPAPVPDSVRIRTLKEVTVTAKRTTREDSLSAAYARDVFQVSDQTIAPQEGLVFYDIFQLLRSYVPGILIENTDTGVMVNFSRYTGIDMFSENASGSGVTFFLNEVPTDVNFISALNPDDIALIKIYKGPTGFILGATRGAISIYTKAGKSVKDWRQKGFETMKLSGFTPVREFMFSEYVYVDEVNSIKNPSPLLWWEPQPKWQGNSVTVNYTVPVGVKEVELTVEGVDRNGKIIYTRQLVKL